MDFKGWIAFTLGMPAGLFLYFLITAWNGQLHIYGDRMFCVF